VIRVDGGGERRLSSPRALDDAGRLVRERQLVGVAARPLRSCRSGRRVGGIARVEDVAGDERPRDADPLIERRERHRADGHPVLVDADQRKRARHHWREDRRPAIRDVDDDPHRPVVPAYHCSV